MNAIDFCPQTFFSNFMDLVTIKVPHFPLVDKVYKEYSCQWRHFLLSSPVELLWEMWRHWHPSLPGSMLFPLEPQNTMCNSNESSHVWLVRQNFPAGNPDTYMALSLDTWWTWQCAQRHMYWSHSHLYLQCRFYCLLKMQEILLEFIMGFPVYPPLQE